MGQIPSFAQGADVRPETTSDLRQLPDRAVYTIQPRSPCQSWPDAATNLDFSLNPVDSGETLDRPALRLRELQATNTTRETYLNRKESAMRTPPGDVPDNRRNCGPRRRDVLRLAAAGAGATALGLGLDTQRATAAGTAVPSSAMNAVYEELITPYKYGIVLPPPTGTMVDSPSVFRYGNSWYMIYIVFHESDLSEPDKGYETFLATSPDLLNWTTLGKILSFRQGTWDAYQAAGYAALQNTAWGGSNLLETYDQNYWMSYLGGSQPGYESYPLSIGIAHTRQPNQPEEWTRLPHPVLSPTDPDARNEKGNLYKSNVILDHGRSLGAPFVMHYNANGGGVERIWTAVSDDMVTWQRYGTGPVIDNGSGISGDPQVVRIGDVWVMFYFGAFWRPGAFNTFACSYDLGNWTKWTGPAIVSSTKPWDMTYAHKPWIIKDKDTVYQFYTAVGNQGRAIALATSRDLRASSGKSASVAATASHTYWQDDVTQVIDGIISYTDSPRNRWTAYASPNSYDWVQLTFPSPIELASMKLYLYNDGGGVQPPRTYDILYRQGQKWISAAQQVKTPTVPAPQLNIVSFDQVVTDAVRVVFVHRGNGIYSGATEIQWSRD